MPTRVPSATERRRKWADVGHNALDMPFVCALPSLVPQQLAFLTLSSSTCAPRTPQRDTHVTESRAILSLRAKDDTNRFPFGAPDGRTIPRPRSLTLPNAWSSHPTSHTHTYTYTHRYGNNQPTNKAQRQNTHLEHIWNITVYWTLKHDLYWDYTDTRIGQAATLPDHMRYPGAVSEDREPISAKTAPKGPTNRPQRPCPSQA